MGWNLGVIRVDLPPGSTNVAEAIGDPKPLGSRAEVDAVLMELLPGFQPARQGWECDDFALEIRYDDDPVDFVAFRPVGNATVAVPVMLAFARRVDAVLFSYSDCEILTEESAAADWERFREWKNRALRQPRPS